MAELIVVDCCVAGEQDANINQNERVIETNRIPVEIRVGNNDGASSARTK